ncbi:MAG: hypothetical protein J6A96_03145 [Clostridia bacterium]|nr:hypothetical protein [Clostridia bacterium]
MSLIVMTAVTGKPSKEKIIEYLKGLKENGINEALLYPRSGCELEYLSQEWFDTISWFIEGAKSLDMSIWLYDDFNWPSGDCKGKVSAIPEFRLKSIVTKGKDIGKISYKSQHNSSLFGEKFFPNLLSSDAVDYFISLTHEEYYKRFSEYFGNVIKGIFTDEPSIGYAAEEDSVPYYDGMEKDYYSLFGRDFFSDMKSEYDNFYLYTIKTVSKKFNECYISKISSWCKSHNILMTGHFLCDDIPTAAVKHSGDFLKNLSTLSLPGIDEISTSFDNINELSLFGAIEYAGRKNGAMAELFALGPCDMSYAKKRAMLYLSACHKIDHYFLAISHLDMRGNIFVCDFFSNFNVDQCDFSGMRLLSSEAEIAKSYAKKDFTPQIYVRYPFELCAKNVTKNLDLSCFYELLNELTYNQIQWKFTNDELVNAPIIELNDRLEIMLDGTVSSIAEICDKFRKNPLVTDLNLDTVRGIFVRKYDDGSFVIINLFAPYGEYLVDGQKRFIDTHEVVLSPDTDQRKRQTFSPTFNIKYHNKNVARLMYLNASKEAKITCQNDSVVSFEIRNGTEAYINGQVLTCTNESDLTFGMRELYSATSELYLKNGVHTIKAENDLKYMPSVLVSGDFQAEVSSYEPYTLALKRRKCTFCKEKFSDYGKVEMYAEVTVPEGVSSIELSGTTLYTTLFIDEISLGEKICSPYIFNVPNNLWGKTVCLRIIQYSSMAPIFGDTDYWDKNAESSQWRGTPSTTKVLFGFDSIKWIY